LTLTAAADEASDITMVAARPSNGQHIFITYSDHLVHNLRSVSADLTPLPASRRGRLRYADLGILRRAEDLIE
jgi:hypothetical protein